VLLGLFVSQHFAVLSCACVAFGFWHALAADTGAGKERVIRVKIPASRIGRFGIFVSLFFIICIRFMGVIFNKTIT
jgi:hypothetical protein